MIKYVVLAFIFLTSCAHKQKEPVYRFGDVAPIEQGYYKGSRFVIKIVVSREVKECKQDEYYGAILRNGMWTEGFICHEDLGARE